MESPTLQSQTIQIDGMTTDTCVQKVRGALSAVKDVTTDSVKVGSAHIRADKTGFDAARAAIGTAGFKVRSHTAHTDNPTGDTKTQHATTVPAVPHVDAPAPVSGTAPVVPAGVNGAGGSTPTKAVVAAAGATK